MIRPQPMVVVDDVEAASQWFQEVVGARSAHGGPEYEMLVDGDTIVLQLHRWDAHEHPNLGDPTDGSRGNGILLWFAVSDVDDVIDRAGAHGARVLDGPLTNPNSGLREIWLAGPDGYVVVAAGP